MVEIIDNSIQLAVLIGCFIYSAVRSIRSRELAWFLITCYYGAYALGLTYWLIFLIINLETPRISLVSDLSWMASVLFLILLENTLRLPGEDEYHLLWSWVPPIFSAVMCFFFFLWGEYRLDILWAILMGACGYYALRGLMFVRRQNTEMRRCQYIYLAILSYILLEHCLWLTSCFWISDDLINPYFWFDFLMTFTFINFIPALRKRLTV